MELVLTDLISIDTLQTLQDAFSDMVGVAAVTTDINGKPVTRGSNFTDFCMKYTRGNELGCQRCEMCDKMGAERAKKTGGASVYYCHAGLVDFAAPIVANGELVGSFIGGQILTGAPDLLKFSLEAEAMGVNPQEYVAAVRKVNILNKTSVDKAAKFLYIISSVISDIAYQGYLMQQRGIELEKASRAKSDFLANMSHEIRTPMNAILGMAEMTLREEMSDSARNNVHQIMASGKNLLAIINDILDFSKVESGKMELVEVNYEPLSVVNDLCSLISTRIGDKDLQFVMDIDPNIPHKLYGDNIRVQQVLVNIINNAVKFTNEGQVKLSIQADNADGVCTLHIAVSDTGIGIKEEDMEKLFQSFQQVDSKRNRNVEGTGLGLAICQNFLKLMGSELKVESVYNQGSTFYFDLQQNIVDPAPCIPKVTDADAPAIFISNAYVREQMVKDLERLGHKPVVYETPEEIGGTDAKLYVVSEDILDGAILEFIEAQPEKKFIVLTAFYSKRVLSVPNVTLTRLPAFSLALYYAMGLIDDFITREEADDDDYLFVAPKAKVLIVDDNNINLTVAKGLLAPLKMQVDLALSAKEAIDKCMAESYNIVFMDHMMPEVDGIEATHMIRRMMPSYKETPIIALTANAVSGAKEMFLAEGMNDFCPKPIDVKDITRKVRTWLPSKLIQRSEEEAAAIDEAAEMAHQDADDRISEGRSTDIPGLDTKAALALLGSENLFWLILEEYYKVYDKKRNNVIKFKDEEDWRNYTIEVHALKSSSRQIGAMDCGNFAAELEKAGNEKDIAYINANTDIFLAEYERVHHLLDSYFAKDSAGAAEATSEIMLEKLEEVKEAMDNFDTLAIDDCIAEMENYSYADEFANLFEQLKNAAEMCDLDACADIISSWENMIQ